jgi:ABC-2 type transport system ATP-binding protein
VINRGRLVRQATVAELTSGSRRVIVATPEAARLAGALRALGFGVTDGGDGALGVAGADPARVGTIAFETGVPVFGLSQEEASLEDVFLELTSEEGP